MAERDKVAIVIAYENSRVNEDLLKNIQYGIEEEGIPYILIELDGADSEEIARKGAVMSKLNVSVGLDADDIGCLIHSNFKIGQNLFKKKILDNNSARDLGSNSARLIKGTPFKLRV